MTKALQVTDPPDGLKMEMLGSHNQAVLVPPPASPTIAQMFQAVIDKGVTAENVSAVKEMAQLLREEVQFEAQKKFASAFVALQADLRPVKANKAIPGNDGTVRSRFASYDEIMEQISPLLLKHGFSVSFTTDYDGPRIVKTCTLEHIGGHKRDFKFAARIGSGPPKSSEAQGDGAASTFAKRYALCEALNIVVDLDTDARAEGGTITADQAFELERRVGETNSNKDAFLKYAGAKTYGEISAAKYGILDEFLARKEQRGK